MKHHETSCTFRCCVLHCFCIALLLVCQCLCVGVRLCVCVCVSVFVCVSLFVSVSLYVTKKLFFWFWCVCVYCTCSPCWTPSSGGGRQYASELLQAHWQKPGSSCLAKGVPCKRRALQKALHHIALSIGFTLEKDILKKTFGRGFHPWKRIWAQGVQSLAIFGKHSRQQEPIAFPLNLQQAILQTPAGGAGCQ